MTPTPDQLRRVAHDLRTKAATSQRGVTIARGTANELADWIEAALRHDPGNTPQRFTADSTKAAV